ncbi:hypothetical protein [Brevundimonas sp.]|uniref:hypothetical protein n=1 Tax=Brevundimonas sp. TaxID=1871086 RepID=UPI003559545C
MTSSEDGEELILNVDTIELVKERKQFRVIVIRGHSPMDDSRNIRVAETYDDLSSILDAQRP